MVVVKRPIVDQRRQKRRPVMAMATDLRHERRGPIVATKWTCDLANRYFMWSQFLTVNKSTVEAFS